MSNRLQWTKDASDQKSLSKTSSESFLKLQKETHAKSKASEFWRLFHLKFFCIVVRAKIWEACMALMAGSLEDKNNTIYNIISENSGVSQACCMGGMIRRYDSRYVSEVWFGVWFALPSLQTVYIKTISYIKGLSPTPSWRLGLFSEGADWAMAQQSEVWANSGYASGMIRGMTRAGDCFCKNKVEGQSFVKYKTKKMREYDSGAWFGVRFEEMQHACGHKFCIRHFWKHTAHNLWYQTGTLMTSAIANFFFMSHATMFWVAGPSPCPPLLQAFAPYQPSMERWNLWNSIYFILKRNEGVGRISL